MSNKKIYYCVGCGEIHPRNNFYISYNKSHNNGILPFCKKFIKEKSYDDEGEVDVDSFKRILRQLDIPFLQEDFDVSSKHDGDVVGDYFRKFNSLTQNRGLTWDDTTPELKNNSHNDRVSVNTIDIDDSNNVYRRTLSDLTKDDITILEDKWGTGYSPEELFLFEKKYQVLRNNYTEKTAMHTEALFNYIRYRVKEEMATADGNASEAKTWGSLASNAAKDAKINPNQLTKADLSDGLSTFSELSQALEKEMDIIPILPQFKYRPNDALDFNIWCYINYMRDLSGLPACEYEDVYKFYDKQKQDYLDQYGDPYGIFEGDTTEKNRENIEKFIKEDNV